MRAIAGSIVVLAGTVLWGASVVRHSDFTAYCGVGLTLLGLYLVFAGFKADRVK